MTGEDDVDCAWYVAIDDVGPGIIIGFDHISKSGVESFVTSLCPHSAIDFAENIIRLAKVALDERPG